jgi:hypothetical protein
VSPYFQQNVPFGGLPPPTRRPIFPEGKEWIKSTAGNSQRHEIHSLMIDATAKRSNSGILRRLESPTLTHYGPNSEHSKKLARFLESSHRELVSRDARSRLSPHTTTGGSLMPTRMRGCQKMTLPRGKPEDSHYGRDRLRYRRCMLRSQGSGVSRLRGPVWSIVRPEQSGYFQMQSST